MRQRLRRWRPVFLSTSPADRFWSSGTALMMALAIIVGLGAGLGALIVVRLIALVQTLFFDGGRQALSLLGSAYIVLLPALGGLLAGVFVHMVAPDATGRGVSDVLAAIATGGGRLRPAAVLAKALAAVVAIGSGGSAGREGPVVHIGAGLGSAAGRLMRLSDRQVINLVASGAAAGIAATFNAPLAGIAFALEVILGELGIQSMGTIVVSAVMASVVSRAALGDAPAFAVPAFVLRSPWELALYLVLGVLAGLAGLLYVRSLHVVSAFFDRLRLRPYLRPALGGLAVGLIGLAVPQVFGAGFDVIADTLQGRFSFGLLVVVLFAKMLATALTIGGGAPGGVLTPGLAIGAALGGAFGLAAAALLPGMTGGSSAYALVGMAAVVGAAARAPVTATILLFELTQDYHTVLPLILASAVGAVLARRFEPQTIYTVKERSSEPPVRSGAGPMGAITVGAAMTPAAELTTLGRATALADVARLFHQTGHHGFAVVDEEGNLFGMITISDVERAMNSGGLERTVEEVCTRQLITAFPDDTLDEALARAGATDVGRIPVVDRRRPRRLLGLLRRGDVIQAYVQELMDQTGAVWRAEKMRLEATAGTELMDISILPGDAAAGKRISELPLPKDCVIVSIRRGRQAVIPRGRTLLLAHDRLVVMVATRAAPALRAAIREGKGAEGEQASGGATPHQQRRDA